MEVPGTRVSPPLKTQGASDDENTFNFIHVINLTVKNVHINYSPQMGICLNNVATAVISNNIIENCFRDGIYAHYSVKLLYTLNVLRNIKDDAMSMHDYGIDAQKKWLAKQGFNQAGESKVINNIVINCYEGFSSIGCHNLTITGNKISNTVNAGIAIFNSEKLFKGSTARANNIIIKSNIIDHTGGTQTIMGRDYKNYGQLTGGISALFVAVEDANNLIVHPTSRINNITVEDNHVTDSYVDGAYFAQIDHLIFSGNTFTHCNLTPSIYCKKTIDISTCTDVTDQNNNVVN